MNAKFTTYLPAFEPVKMGEITKENIYDIAKYCGGFVKGGGITRDMPKLYFPGPDETEWEATVGQLFVEVRGMFFASGRVQFHAFHNLPDGIGAGGMERERTKKLWGSVHDAGHANGKLTAAAAAYAEVAEMQAKGHYLDTVPNEPIGWPWESAYWKPSQSPKRNLEKAMALLAAEWDRMDAVEKSNPPGNGQVP